MRDVIHLLRTPSLPDRKNVVCCPACDMDIRSLPPVNLALRSIVRQWASNADIQTEDRNDGDAIRIMQSYFVAM